MRTMDKILVIVAVLTVVFTVVMIWLYYRTGGVPDTLVGCWFAAIGGECGVMGWIKTTKERREQRRWDLEDEQRREQTPQSAGRTAPLDRGANKEGD